MICKNCNRKKERSKQQVEKNKLAAREQVRKLIIKSYLSPGDIVMLTAAIRDLHLAHPKKFITKLDTSCGELWESNPYITKDLSGSDVEEIHADYDLVHSSNTNAYHFIHGYAVDLENKLNVRIPISEFKGDIHISDTEKSWISQLEEIGIEDDFWIIVAGGKTDFTAKWWNPQYYQDVVDHFKGKITFVQTGENGHFHPNLKGVVNLIGKTDLRQFIRLMYHSVGVVCPVTFAMHCAAAVPVRGGYPKNRACVVIAGGREPAQWEAYPHHRFLSLNGSLPCCDNGGCWKSRCTKIKDKDKKNSDEDSCLYPVTINVSNEIKEKYDKIIDGDYKIAKCMDMIKPKDVIRAIEWYYEGGALKYGSCIPDKIPEKAKEYIAI